MDPAFGWAVIIIGSMVMTSVVVLFVVMGRDTPKAVVKAPELPSPLPAVFQDIVDADDPWIALRDYWWEKFPDHVWVGTVAAGPFGALARAAMLVLGPVGQGKSTKIVIPQIILHNAAAVIVSLKLDLARATAQSRARLGTVWHFNPGEGPLMPGARELRWSPLQGSQDWAQACRNADFLCTETLSTKDESSGGQFWRLTAETVLAVLFYVAANLGEDMKWVIRGLAQDPDDLHSVVWRAVLKFMVRENEDDFARLSYDVVVAGNHRTRRDTFTTAANVVKPYLLEHSYATTVNPNFDPVTFAQSKDTIYITGSLEEQAKFAPLITSLLTVIRRAQLAYFEAQEAEGNTPNHMHWFLDEFAGMSPLKKFPELVTHSGSTGLRITACLQDLSYAKRLFGDVGENLLSVMSAVVIPGTTNKTVTELLAQSQGKLFVSKTSRSSSQSHTVTVGSAVTRGKEVSTSANESTTDQFTTGESESFFYIERCTPADITDGELGVGRHGYGRKGVLFFFLGGLISVRARAWWETPFVHAVMSSTIHAARWFVDERALLPIPDIRTKSRHVSEALHKRWQSAQIEVRKNREFVQNEEDEDD